MTQQTILVTGATGTVGGAVTRALVQERVRVRALVRDPKRARLAPGVEALQGDLSDPGSLEPALDGVDSVFLIWPFMTSDGAEEVLDAIRQRATRVVYLSTIGASDQDTASNPIMRFHGELESAIEGSGLDWVLLQPASFAANTLGWAEQFAGGVVRAPFGDQLRPMVHEDDIAAVAVRALLEDNLVGTRPQITGPENLTTREQVQVIGAALDLTVRYEEISVREAAAGARAAGWPEDLVSALYSEDRTFESPQITTTVQDLTGRTARTLAQWAHDHADAFKPSS